MASSLAASSLPTSVGILLIAVLGYISVSSIISYRKLRQFPGPPLAAWTQLWLFWQVVSKQQRDAQVDAHSKYGPVVRVGPNLLLTNDPDVIRHMNLPASKWRRSGWYNAFNMDPRADSVFSTRDEKQHSELRQLEIGGYQGKGINTLEPSIDARTIEVLDLIRTKYNGKVMDIAKIARYFTLDVLSTVAFGAPFGFMAANDDLWSYNQAEEDFMTILILSAHHRLIRWLLQTSLMQWLAGPKVTDDKGFGPALAFASKAVAERYGDSPKQHKDMLGYFVDKGLSQTQCEVESFIQIIAGSDSTTTTVRNTMYLLAGNPTAYLRLRAEIDSAVSDGRVSSPVITHAEAQRLPYLSACVWEGLRMYPPLFGLKSKLAPPGGEQINEHFFPEGTELGSCDYSFVRSKEIFGDDADLFRPDRWIEASQEQKVKYRYTVDTIFGSGRYQCLGRHIAFIELHKVFFEVGTSVIQPLEKLLMQTAAAELRLGSSGSHEGCRFPRDQRACPGRNAYGSLAKIAGDMNRSKMRMDT